MKHVGERLGVHQSVLNRDVEQLPERTLAVIRRRRGLDHPVQSLADAVPILVYVLKPRPVLGPIGRQTPSYRVDAEREKAIELGAKAREIAGTAEQVPIERFQVAKIEDDAVALGNRPVVHRFGPDHPEERVRLRSRLQEP